MRTLEIKEVLNGWIVTVGCQQVAYISSDRLLNDLREYMHNAEEFEKRFLDTATNKHLMASPRPLFREESCGTESSGTPHVLTGSIR